MPGLLLNELLLAEAEHAAGVADGNPALLHQRLAKVDPVAAERIHPNDVVRTIRALEINTLSGRTASSQRDAHRASVDRFEALHIALDPGAEVTRSRIDARCEKMIEAGLLQEVRKLRRLGYGPELRPMQAIGYRHINPVVDGSDTLANALESMQRDTRRFSRRQRIWLRAVPGVNWLDPREPARVVDAVERYVASRKTCS